MSNCSATLLNAKYLILIWLLNHSCTLTSKLASIALYESCDIQDKPQLAISARFILTLIKEELLDIVPLKDRTGGIDVKEAMMAAIEKANPPIAKLRLRLNWR